MDVSPGLPRFWPARRSPMPSGGASAGALLGEVDEGLVPDVDAAAAAAAVAGGDGAVGTVCDATDAARVPDDGAVRDVPVCLLCVCARACEGVFPNKSHHNDRMCCRMV